MKVKLILFVITPFIVGLIIHSLIDVGTYMDSSIILSIATILLRIWGFIAVIFWFFAGKQFKNSGLTKIKSFILGNSLWMISLIIYIWQFLLLDDTRRNLFLARIAHHYVLGFMSIASNIMFFFEEGVDGNTVVLSSYLIMLIVFIVGFIYVPKNKYEEVDDQSV